MSAAAKSEVVTLQPAQSTALTPMEMLDRAIAGGAGLEVIEKIMALQERWETNEARKQFNAAISAAKAEIPPIPKNRVGHNDKRYADFAATARVIDPILAKHGLHYRFRTKQDDRIHVTCILSCGNHSEESELSGLPDKSGSKNDIQAIGSTCTYLQRYTIFQMLGLAAADDDDGKATGASGPVSDEQIKALTQKMAEVGANVARFCTIFKIENPSDLPAAKFDEAIRRLTDYGKQVRK